MATSSVVTIQILLLTNTLLAYSIFSDLDFLRFRPFHASIDHYVSMGSATWSHAEAICKFQFGPYAGTANTGEIGSSDEWNYLKNALAFYGCGSTYWTENNGKISHTGQPSANLGTELGRILIAYNPPTVASWLTGLSNDLRCCICKVPETVAVPKVPKEVVVPKVPKEVVVPKVPKEVVVPKVPKEVVVPKVPKEVVVPKVPKENVTPKVPNDGAVPCYNTNDLIILLDASGSIKPVNYTISKNFVNQLASAFTVQNTSGVGVIVFSDIIMDIVNINNTLAPSEVSSSILYAPHRANSTNTHLGIDAAIAQFNSYQRKYPRNIVIITDGVSNKKDATIASAKRAISMGIRVISVGVGSKINQKELLAMTGGNSSLVFTSKNFDQLVKLLNPVSRVICENST